MGRCPFQGHWKWLTSLVHPQHLIATILWNIAVFQSRLSVAGKDLPCYTCSFWLSPQGASQLPSEDGKVGWRRGQQPCIHQGGGGDAPLGITQEGLPKTCPPCLVQIAINDSHQNDIKTKHDSLPETIFHTIFSLWRVSDFADFSWFWISALFIFKCQNISMARKTMSYLAVARTWASLQIICGFCSQNHHYLLSHFCYWFGTIVWDIVSWSGPLCVPLLKQLINDKPSNIFKMFCYEMYLSL